MREVYLVQHVHLFEHGTEDIKVIGVYRTREAADAAIERLGTQPGFRDSKDTFCVDAYELDIDHWIEGYVTV